MLTERSPHTINDRLDSRGAPWGSQLLQNEQEVRSKPASPQEWIFEQEME
jgi:hypothetical protein